MDDPVHVHISDGRLGEKLIPLSIRYFPGKIHIASTVECAMLPELLGDLSIAWGARTC